MQPQPTWAGSTTAARRAREGDAPTISVLVTSAAMGAELRACLKKLQSKCESLGAQLVVVRAAEEEELAGLEREYPTIRFVAVAAGASVKEMRVAGIAEAEGDIVLIQEDTATVGDDWLVPRILERTGGTAE